MIQLIFKRWKKMILSLSAGMCTWRLLQTRKGRSFRTGKQKLYLTLRSWHAFADVWMMILNNVQVPESKFSLKHAAPGSAERIFLTCNVAVGFVRAVRIRVYTC